MSRLIFRLINMTIRPDCLYRVHVYLYRYFKKYLLKKGVRQFIFAKLCFFEVKATPAVTTDMFKLLGTKIHRWKILHVPPSFALQWTVWVVPLLQTILSEILYVSILIPFIVWSHWEVHLYVRAPFIFFILRTGATYISWISLKIQKWKMAK